MHPALRVVFAGVCALVRARLESGGARLFAAIIGALAGLAISEVLYIRSSLTSLRAELSDVRNSLRRAPEAARYAPPAMPPQTPRPPPAAEAAPSTETASSTYAREDLKPLGTPWSAPKENRIIQSLRE